MHYAGSKSRIVKDLLSVILPYRRNNDQWWVEPFVGGGNVIAEVVGNRLGADINPHTIRALDFIRKHPDKIPKDDAEFSKEDFLRIKAKYRANKPLSGYECMAMYCYSYGSLWAWAYARQRVSSGYASLITQSRKLIGVELVCCNYLDLQIPPHSIIYCDPPYARYTKYYPGKTFDHQAFWAWCKEKQQEGHTVFVSEYEAPSDFVCIFEKKIRKGINGKHVSYAVEKLFVHRSCKEVLKKNELRNDSNKWRYPMLCVQPYLFKVD